MSKDRRLEIIKRFCKDDYTKIENYDLAKADNFEGWELHHRLEINSDYRNSIKDMKLMNIYLHRPAGELVFMRHDEHRTLHHKGRIKSAEECKKLSDNRKGFKYTDEAKKRMSESHKGKHWTLINDKRCYYDEQ